MDMKEILNLIMSVDDNGLSNTAVSFGMYDLTRKEITERSFDSVLGPKINIHGMTDKVVVDMVFKTDRDTDLYKIWNILNDYQDAINVFTVGKSDIIPHLHMILLPMEQEGSVYAEADTPIMWALTALNVGKPINTIRIVFDTDKMKFYTSDDIDLDDTKAEVAMDIHRRNSLNDMALAREMYRYDRLKEMEENRKER